LKYELKLILLCNQWIDFLSVQRQLLSFGSFNPTDTRAFQLGIAGAGAIAMAA